MRYVQKIQVGSHIIITWYVLDLFHTEITTCVIIILIDTVYFAKQGIHSNFLYHWNIAEYFGKFTKFFTTSWGHQGLFSVNALRSSAKSLSRYFRLNTEQTEKISYLRQVFHTILRPFFTSKGAPPPTYVQGLTKQSNNSGSG